MKTKSLMRCAGLAVMLAIVLPAPASPQIGGFIKRKIKEKIAEKAVQTVVGTDTTSPSATGSPATGPGASRARRSAPVQAGPTFSENVLEITPALLDQLQKGLAAERADQKAAAAEAAKILSADDYKKCEQSVYTSAEGRKAYQEYAAAPKDDMAAIQKASEVYAKRLDALKDPKCGPGGSEAQSARYALSQRPIKAGQVASGLTEYQYAILKERVEPFCSLPQPPAAAATGETRVPVPGAYSAGIAYVYAPSEIAALQGRCPTLLAALNAGGPAQTPAAGNKKARPVRGT